MPTTSSMLIFMAAASVLIVMPGPNLIFILTRGIGEGRRTAVASSLGVDTGTLFHVAAASVGLSAILASSAVAFNTVKYLGTAYMIYLGIRTLSSRDHAVNTEGTIVHERLRKVFIQGIVVNMLNPKVALFFLAFLPQFVDLSRGNASLQILVFGLIFFAIGLFVDTLCALSSGAIGGWLRRIPSTIRWQHYFSGAMYLLLGAATAFSGHGSRKH